MVLYHANLKNKTICNTGINEKYHNGLSICLAVKNNHKAKGKWARIVINISIIYL